MPPANTPPEPGTPEVRDPKVENHVERCVTALAALVPVTGWAHEFHARIGGVQVDAKLVIEVDGRRHEFALEVKRRLTAAHLGPMAYRARLLGREGVPTVVCTDRVAPALGAELREAGIGYLDLGGNAHLDGPGLYLRIDGQRSVAKAKLAGLRGTEARLLGLFLCEQRAGVMTQEQLGVRAGIALGAVGKARARLEELHVLTRFDRRRWRVTDFEKGIKLFADGWGAVIRPKLSPIRYRGTHGEAGPQLDGMRQVFRQMNGKKICLAGGEWGAAILTKGLKNYHATLHVEPGERRNVLTELGLVPADHGPITLLDRYGGYDNFPFKWDHGNEVAHPLLVWAECLTVTDERVASVADRVRQTYLSGAP